MGTDKDWEIWGSKDPYFGVLSLEQFRQGSLSEADRAKFFESGDNHVDELLSTIRARFQPNFAPDRSLDFGCGVGRLLIPLARRSGSAVGVDVSRSMLAEAERNCVRMGATNVQLVESDDCLSKAGHAFDLVHSHIVFAHIDPKRGHAIIKALADRVVPGGFIAVQVLYVCHAARLTRALVRLRYKFRPANALRNILRGRPLSEPPMQLHVYDLPALLVMLRQSGFGDPLLITGELDETFGSVVIVAQRSFVSR